MPKVSVLIPVYNVEKYLRECLDSVVNQTLRDLEIICINDGSTDNSLEILKEYQAKDSRIRIIDKENTGYGDSMNKGLESATAKYIGIIESDDFAKPNMYEELYDLISKDDLDFVKSDFYHAYKNHTFRSTRLSEFPTHRKISPRECMDIFDVAPSIWSCLYSKDFLDKNNIRFLPTPGASYQDISFFYKTLMFAKSFVLTDKAYVYYRQDNLRSSVNRKDKVFCLCDEFSEIYSTIKKHKNLESFLQMIYAREFEAYRWNIIRIDKSYVDSFLDRYYAIFKAYKDKGLLKDEFYQYLIHKADFDLMMKSKDLYRKHFFKQKRKDVIRNFKRKIISVKINSQRASICVFGKQILRFER